MPLHTKRYTIILILGALSTISPFAIDMYLPAFPRLPRHCTRPPPEFPFPSPAISPDWLSGAVAFSGLLVYVASSPIIFMEVFHVSAQKFGAIFAGLATGFIGSNQLNVLLLRRFSSEQIYRATSILECPVALLLFAGTIFGGFGLGISLVLLFIALSSLGLAYPNAAALALVPFDRNIGSASVMLGFLQIGVSGLASATISIFDSHTRMPVAFVLATTSCLGLAILVIGKRKIPNLQFVEEKDANPISD